jgi:transcriptional regulator with XRE-family HTH domain
MAEAIRISLASARINANLTQKEVAEALKVSNATIVSWEKGLTEPSVSQAYALSDLYGIPMDNIIFLPSKSNFI